MKLENRLPDEGINSSAEHPLREAAWLVAAVLVTLALAIWLIGLAAQWAAPRLPFSAELRLAAALPPEPALPLISQRRSRALQQRSEALAAVMDWPADMPLQLRAEPHPLVNAYATVGGRIRVHEGLMRRLGSLQALDALLAHEMAHVRQRHVAANAGRGLATALLLGLIAGEAGAGAAQGLIGGGAQLGLLAHSREQEREADALALAASVRLHGHGGGLIELLQGFADEGGAALPMLSTHPGTAERIAEIRRLAAERGWALGGPRTPLGEPLRALDAPILRRP